MIKLTKKQILEFYDVPQLFVATDAMNSNYLCVLYSQEAGYEYLAVRISDFRLKVFMMGELDLRKAYLNPEQDDTLYHVTVVSSEVHADRLLEPSEITKEMLPEPGYYYDSEDAIEESHTEAIEVEIPTKDYSLLESLVNRMGWAVKNFGQASRKIAVL